MSTAPANPIDSVIDQVTGFWRTAVLRAAFELHLPDHLMSGRDSPDIIAAAEGADARAIKMILDVLCAFGFVKKSGGAYKLQPAIENMLPVFRRSTALLLNDATWSMWGRVSESARTGKPIGPGLEYWIEFAHSTREIALQQGREIAGFAKRSNARATRILDVGCGSGGVGFGFLLGDPTTTVTAVDSAEVIAVASELAKELRIIDRVSLRCMDILGGETFGDGAFDVVIAASLVHLFDSATNKALINKIAQALPVGGTIFLNDIIADDESQTAVYPLLFSIEMLLRTPGGMAYTLPEISSWLQEAGFGSIRSQPMMGNMTLIAATKDGPAGNLRFSGSGSEGRCNMRYLH